MKKLFVLIAAFAFAAQAVPCQAWENIGEMPDPLRSFQENSPNYNPDFYNRTYDNDRSYSDSRSQSDYTTLLMATTSATIIRTTTATAIGSLFEDR